jgi:acyl-CoA oxidase
VAKTLLTNYQAEFGELDTLGMARLFADQVVETVIERTAARAIVQRLIDAVPGRDEDVSLFDRGWQLSLFEWREKHALDGVARRLRKGMTSGDDPFDAFNSVQDHVLLAARAHIDRVILETFVAAIDRCPDDAVAALLSRVCDLHVLSMLERDRAWFLEHGRLTPARSKAVITAVNELCRELRPHAELLVDAFGIPDEVLAAPIALGAEARRQHAKGQPAGPEQP